MNFSDEEYVRLYVKDGTTWLALTWVGQAVLALTLRKFDKSGILSFGRHGPAKAIALATGVPLELVEQGLARILDEDVWQITDSEIIWPTYVEAQTCSRSDRARKRIERAAKASKKPAKSSESFDVTKTGDFRTTSDAAGHSRTDCDKCHDSSEPVTASHKLSENVTLCLALPCLSQQQLAGSPAGVGAHTEARVEEPTVSEPISSAAATSASRTPDGHEVVRAPDPSPASQPAALARPSEPAAAPPPNPLDTRVPCPPDLKLTPDQIGNAVMAGAIRADRIERLTAQFVGKYLADPADKRTIEAWRKCLSTMILSEGRKPERTTESAPIVRTGRRNTQPQPSTPGRDWSKYE